MFNAVAEAHYKLTKYKTFEEWFSLIQKWKIYTTFPMIQEHLSAYEIYSDK